MVTLAILKQKTIESCADKSYEKLSTWRTIWALPTTTDPNIMCNTTNHHHDDLPRKWVQKFKKVNTKNIKHHWFWIIWNYVDLKSGDHTTVDCVNITIIWSNGWAKNACDWKSNQTNQCEQSLFVHGIQKNLKSGIAINICDSQDYWMM